MDSFFASSENTTLDEVLNTIDEAVCVTDGDWVFLGANMAFARFYGLIHPRDLIGKSAFEVYPGFEQSVFYDSCQQTIRTGEQTCRIGYSANLKTWIAIRCYRISHDRFAACVHRLTDDVSKSGYVSRHDTLTSLPNRWAFEADLNALGEHPQPLTVALFDISHFKQFNETVGFHCGDRILMETAARLKIHAGTSDRVYRIGNDQFLWLSTQQQTLAENRAASILEVLSLPMGVEGCLYAMRFNAGVCFTPQGSDPHQTLRKAEIALSHGKKIGGGVASYRPDMEVSGYDPTLIRALDEAMASHQLCLFLQPQIDLLDEKVVGAEVLVRWQHPVRGLLPPSAFLPFAEETGLIRQIDRYVVAQAFDLVSRLRAVGLPLPLSINLSAQSLCDTTLVAFFSEQLDRAKIDPSQVCVEITETSLMEDVASSQEVAQALSAMGIGLSVDDFGSGYASMRYLLRYPSQFLKIDVDFTRNMTTSPAHAVMVKNLIALAHGLGIGVVAEGVETLDHRDLLRTYGCDLAQGYHYAKPMPFDAFCDWVRAQGLGRFESAVFS